MSDAPALSRPDLADPAARRAYRRELLAVARKRRALGFVCVAAGVGLWAWPRMGGPWMFGPVETQQLGYLLLAIGLALFIWVMVKCTGHHRQRMRG